MPRLILRRSGSAAASPADAAAVVAEHFGNILDRTDDTMLADVDQPAGVEAIKAKLPGWIVSEQATSKIPVPDARLKIRRER